MIPRSILRRNDFASAHALWSDTTQPGITSLNQQTFCGTPGFWERLPLAYQCGSASVTQSMGLSFLISHMVK